jgi:hypothetical protein
MPNGRATFRTNCPLPDASGAILATHGLNNAERTMMLDLTDEDARMLRELLQDYLPELKREVARTDVKTLRHELVQRQELCERLLDRLAKVAM